MLLCLSQLSQAASLITIEQARVHETPPGLKVMAGYMTVTNLTNQAINLDKFNSPDFQQVELHKTEISDGTASMVSLPKLVIPAGASISLEPGGLHLMLIKPLADKRAGEQITLQFRLSNNTVFEQTFDVIKATSTHDHSHH